MRQWIVIIYFESRYNNWTHTYYVKATSQNNAESIVLRYLQEQEITYQHLVQKVVEITDNIEFLPL